MAWYEVGLIVGLAAMFCGFAMRWTDGAFGVAQLTFPDAFETVGGWMIRLGSLITVVTGLVYTAAQLR